jgi:hypothetical protein
MRVRSRRLVATTLGLVATMLPGSAAADGPTFTVANVTVTEGGTATFVIANGPDSPAEFTWQTKGATASAGSDFAGGSGEVTVAGGATGTVAVAVAPDALDEADETFTLEVSNASGDVAATATIEDDDSPPAVTIASPPAPVAEGAVAAFPVTLSAASGRDVHVGYQTIPASSADFTGTT